MKKKKKLLEGHKKVGKKFIPPMMQLSNLVLTSFRDDTLPDLIWLSPFFTKHSNKTAVDGIFEFLLMCNHILQDEAVPSLVFISNFNKLSPNQKQLLLDGFVSNPVLDFVLETVQHQNYLFKDYPLKFLFGSSCHELDREICITDLENEVAGLLDRYSTIATTIQVTAVVSMLETGKMHFTNGVEIPDFNAIFTAPTSDAAKRAASFARANLNAGLGFDNYSLETNLWSKSFWDQCFSLSRCR